MRTFLCFVSFSFGVCIFAGEDGISIPPEINRLQVDLDGDGKVTKIDKITLTLMVEVGCNLNDLLEQGVITKEGINNNIMQILSVPIFSAIILVKSKSIGTTDT